MKTMIPRAMAAMALLLAPALQATAQQTKPMVVISVASPQESLADVQYLANSAGVVQFANMAQFFAQPYLKHLDQTKPIGFTINMGAGPIPEVLGFLPVTDVNGLLATVANSGTPLPAPQDVGGGVLKFETGGPMPLFVKQQGGYAFLGQSPAALGSLPANPVAMLGGLDKTYNVAVQLNVRSIPEMYRQQAVTQLQALVRAAQANNAGANAELQAKLAGNSMQQVQQLIEESEQLTIGWAIDAQNQATYVDLLLTAVPGTELAGQMQAMADSRTDFGGFNIPNAAATMSMTRQLTRKEIDQFGLMFQVMEQQAMQDIDNNQGLPNEQAKSAVKEVLRSMLKVAKDTVLSGKMDGGAALLLSETSPKLQLAAGGYVANGGDFDAAFRKLVEMAKNEPNFPGVNFNAGNHQGVAFHTMNVPLPGDEADARRIFGDQVSVALGVGQTSVYVAVGGDSVSLLKSVIDKSAAGASSMAPPMRLQVALTPIVQFAKSIDESQEAQKILQALANAGGKDHVTITVKSIPNGLQYRVDVEEGILQAIGQGVQAALPGGGF